MKKLVYVLMFVILSFSVFGASIGDDDFNADQGIWNENVDLNAESHNINLPNSQDLPPIFDDLDGDGDLEGIIMDNHTIYLVENTTLDFLDSSNQTCNIINNFETFDIDGDGQKEIIYSCNHKQKNNYIYIWNTTGNELKLNTVKEHGANPQGISFIKCVEVGRCVGIRNGNVGNYVSGVAYYTFNFNMTSTFLQNSFTANSGCTPLFLEPQLSDYNNDGLQEIIFSHIFLQGASNTAYEIVVLNENGSYIDHLEISGFYSYDGVNDCTSQEVRRLVTSPMVGEFTTEGVDHEIILGFQTSEFEYQFNVYDSTLNFIDDHPETDNADGIMISNLIRGDFIPYATSTNKDFCVLGVDSDGDLNIVCGTENEDELFLGETITYDYASDINYTYPSWILAHATQQKQTTTNGKNLHEVITSSGVFNLNYGASSTSSLIYSNPRGSGIVDILDITGQNEGHPQFVVLTPATLWAYQDGFLPSEPYMEWSVNPCIDSVWKLNSTVQISTTVYGETGSTVCANISIYNGDTREENTDFLCGVSGSTFNLATTLNKTISNGVAKIFINNSDYPTVTEEYSFIFNVANNGVEFGDCVTTGTTVEITLSNGSVISGNVTPQAGNSVTNAVTAVDSRLNIGTLAIWLIFMAIVTITIMGTTAKEYSDHPAVVVGTGGIVLTIMFVLGIIFGFIPVGVLITLIIAVIGIGIIMLGRKLNGNQ